MCHLTDRYYAECTHWGVPLVETHCAKGFASRLKSGCEDNVTVGSQRIVSLCPACTYRASVTGMLDQTSYPASVPSFPSSAPSRPSSISSFQSSASSSQSSLFSLPEQLSSEQVQQDFRITHRVGNTVTSLTREGLENQAGINRAVKAQKSGFVYLPRG